MRLVAPMQSWGVQSDFTHRDTGLEPSKSGVIGLLCAALGKPRDEAHPDNRGKPTLVELANLRMGARVDREGLLKRDYHTAQDVRKASATSMKDTKGTEVSERFYIADAAFLVGLEGDDLELLHKLDDALHHPHWFLFLGRKAFVPSEPVWVENGVQENQPLEEALDPRAFSRLRKQSKDYDERMRLVIEVKPGEYGEITRRDQPLSFVKSQRAFDFRNMKTASYDDHPISGYKEAA
jgi:CRISPR system Cascade subunit CasD